MDTKKLFVAICVAALTGSASAQLTGSITATNDPVYSIASATGSSLMLAGTNIVANTTGSFVGTAPLGGLFQVESGRTTTINGLSTSPLMDPISDFFIFSSGYKFGGGTIPPNRFEFNLQTIT